MDTLKNKLREALNAMDVPEGRKEPTVPNLRWLQRNLFIRNKEHKDFPFAVHLIGTLLTISGEDPRITGSEDVAVGANH